MRKLFHCFAAFAVFAFLFGCGDTEKSPQQPPPPKEGQREFKEDGKTDKEGGGKKGDGAEPEPDPNDP